MAKKRKYTKRSDYWEKRKNQGQDKSLEALASANQPEVFEPKMLGDNLYETTASRSLRPNNAQRSKSRKNSTATTLATDRFKNIDDGLLPFAYSEDSVSAGDAIRLTQKAYFNIAAFRSTIDLLSEFADADIYLDGGSAKSRKLIKAWLQRINIDDLKSQYFREYYRSSNFFAHRIDGKLKATNAGKLYEAYGAQTNKNFKIPIRYLVLNPTDIVAKNSLSFSHQEYAKVLTPFEVARLKNPQTEHEKETYESLPEETQKMIQSGAGGLSNERAEIKLDSKFLHAIFAKKQDYEPLAVPYAFSVLDDMNKKMELKKIDQAIARSIENVVLLVTMGAEPDKGGINHKAIDAMQQIFQNESVGRVLVSDYTTKADFVIPDLKKVMGAEKYEILNKDIQEGLQNVLIGDTKYSDGSMKMKIFMSRLQESRNQFLKEFLQPEIKRICKGLGLKSYPEVKFVNTDTLDNSDLTKLATRMMELGILTPEQGMDVVHRGEFPQAVDLKPSQEEFKESREKGYYTPMVNSINFYENEEDSPNSVSKPSGNGNPAAPSGEGRPASVTNPSPSGGRPMGQSNASISKSNLIEVTNKASEFETKAYRDFAFKYGMDELDENRKDLVGRVCESIFASKEMDEWEATLAKVVDNLEEIQSLDAKPEVLDFGAEHNLNDLCSAILYHSTKISV